MTLYEHYIKILEGWEKVKSHFLRSNVAWSLTPAETAAIWDIRQDAIKIGMPFDIIHRYNRLFDKH
jgi:hypothetical protein